MSSSLRNRQHKRGARTLRLLHGLGRTLAFTILVWAHATWASTAAPAQPPSPSPTSPPPGRYDLWQDGEGGQVCKLTLQSGRTIGGHPLKAATGCDERLSLGGAPQAWFVDAQGRVVIVDATRRVLLRMEPLDNGEYRDRRRGDYVDAVILSPAKKR
jgi:hypothetical protein